MADNKQLPNNVTQQVESIRTCLARVNADLSQLNSELNGKSAPEQMRILQTQPMYGVGTSPINVLWDKPDSKMIRREIGTYAAKRVDRCI